MVVQSWCEEGRVGEVVRDVTMVAVVRTMADRGRDQLTQLWRTSGHEWSTVVMG